MISELTERQEELAEKSRKKREELVEGAERQMSQQVKPTHGDQHQLDIGTQRFFAKRIRKGTKKSGVVDNLNPINAVPNPFSKTGFTIYN